MGNGAARSVGGAPLATRIAIVAVALVAVLLVLQSASIQLVRQQNWSRLLLPFPDDSRALLLRYGVTEGRMLAPEPLPPGLLPAIRAARRLDALDPLPFVAAGLISENENPRAALPMFDVGIRRDPRRTAARLHFIRAALLTERFAPAIAIMAQTVTLRPEQADRLIPALVLARNAPDGARLVSQALRRDPGLRAKAAVYLSTTPDPENLVPQIAAVGLDPASRTTVIGNLAQQGRYVEAYRLWRGASGLGAQPFDPELLGRPAPAPFGWTLASDSNLNANFGSDSGTRGHLTAELFGQVRTTVVSQALLLPPGRYALSAAVESGGVPTSSGAFEWSLACTKQDGELTMIRFPVAQAGPATADRLFEVPAGCPAQTLTLTGIPDDSGAATRMTFTRISVRPA